ncbi:hypothetical protein [Dokdonella soli]|uniref:TIGR03016 family PEP-CTERM system-associated outer membrane protein n=1 Tax=Dokdonella soli TaxID=529810 RepID=A0ABN1IKC0_9GAMM
MALLRSAGRVLGLIIPVVAWTQAHAARFDYRLELGIEHNDNVNLSENNPISQNILEPALGFTFAEEGSDVQARAEGILQYRDYLGGAFGNELRSQLGGHLNWVMLPERLSLVVEDYLGVQPINTLLVNTPTNVQQTNVIAVGPNLNFRLGSTTHGQAELRYINSYAEETREFDSNRLAGALRIIKDLSATSQLSGNVQVEHVNFTHSGSGPNYDRYNLYARYARSLRLFDYAVDLGYTSIDSGPPFGSHAKPLLRANADWRPSERSTVTLTAAHQYSDAASGMIDTVELRVKPSLGLPIPTSIATGGVVTSSAPYLESRVNLGYTYRVAQGAIGAEAFYDKLDYLNEGLVPSQGNLKRSVRGGDVVATWLLRPELTLGANVTADHVRYSAIARTDKDLTFGVFLLQQWARHWSWRLNLAHYKRDSTVPGQGASQNIIYFGVAYTR